MSVYGSFSGSHMDDAAELEFGRYVIHLSDQVSQVELLLNRLAGSVALNEPRLEPLLQVARDLVAELQRAESSREIAERDLAVNQLFPYKVYRSVLANVGEFRELPDMLNTALFEDPPAAWNAASAYAELATVVDRLNTTLQQQADEAVAG